MYCPKCGKENVDGLKSCASCGSRLPHSRPNDYLGWSLFSLLFFFPLALVPVFIALLSRMARRQGNLQIAEARAASARRCFWVVVIVGAIFQGNYIYTHWDELRGIYDQQRALMESELANDGYLSNDATVGDATSEPTDADAADRSSLDATDLPATATDSRPTTPAADPVERMLQRHVEIIVDDANPQPSTTNQ